MAWTVSRIKVSVWALAALFLAVLLGAAGTLAWTTRQTALENRMEQVKRFGIRIKNRHSQVTQLCRNCTFTGSNASR